MMPPSHGHGFGPGRQRRLFWSIAISIAALCAILAIAAKAIIVSI